MDGDALSDEELAADCRRLLRELYREYLNWTVAAYAELAALGDEPAPPEP